MDLTRLREILNTEIISSVKVEELSVLMTQLALMARSNVPLMEALNVVEENSSKSLGKIIARVKERVSRGVSLSDAFLLEQFDSAKLVASIIAAGEKTGNLHLTFSMMSDYYKSKDKSRKEIRASLIYPVILIVVSLLVIIFSFVYIMPTYMDLFRTRDLDLPLITRIFIGISNFLTNNFLFLILGLILVLLASHLLSRASQGYRLRRDRLAFNLPLFSAYSSYQLYLQSSFTIAILSACKVPMLDIMDIIIQGADNSFVRLRLEEVKEKIEQGQEIHRSFGESGLYSKLFLTMLRTGEESGNLSQIMTETGEFYSERFVDRIRYISKILEPVTILIMGLIVALIIFSIALPMFDLINLE